MKFKFLALALSILTLSSVHVEAKSVKGLSPKKAKILSSKEKSKKSHVKFFGAEDTSPITLDGPATTYTQLTFTQDKLSNGTSITPDAAGSQFLLQKGTYKISVTATFQSTLHTPFLNIALQLGPNTIFVNTDSQESFGEEEFSISSIYKVIEVDKPTKLSILAKNTAGSSSAVLTTRSIVIQKL